MEPEAILTSGSGRTADRRYYGHTEIFLALSRAVDPGCKDQPSGPGQRA